MSTGAGSNIDIRNGTPVDIAGTVAWLLNGDAAFVTGQEITVDGGCSLGGISL